MIGTEHDAALRLAAFEHVRRLSELHDPLRAEHLKAGFLVQGERVPLINPQRGIFKPPQMRFLLSIKTVPKARRSGLVRRPTPSAPPNFRWGGDR